jgi:hypothetical protein
MNGEEENRDWIILVIFVSIKLFALFVEFEGGGIVMLSGILWKRVRNIARGWGSEIKKRNNGGKKFYSAML